MREIYLKVYTDYKCGLFQDIIDCIQPICTDSLFPIFRFITADLSFYDIVFRVCLDSWDR